MKAKNVKQTRGRAKNAEIVSAARILFLENGFSATSMDLIADTAGVSKRTVYSHFENKENLFAAVMMDLCKETCPPDVAQDAPDPSMSPEHILTKMGKKYLSVNLLPDAIALYHVVLCESGQFPELGKMYWNMGPETIKRHISDLLSQLNQKGELSVPDPDSAALQFIGMLRWPLDTPLLFGITKSPTAKDIDKAVKQAVSIILKGLKST